MDNSTHEDEEKLLAIVNAKLDAKLKEAEIAEKMKPWKTLVQPTTLMALLTALTTLTAGTVTMLQYYGQKGSEQSQQNFAELSAERGLVLSILHNTSDTTTIRAQLTALAVAGLLETTKDGLIKAGWVDLKLAPLAK
ncbi:MAG: hypothetical protein ABR863_07315 [Roseiarcus sp.]|jgi:hypothetical protein